jgi:hypothetical protein
MKQRLKPLRPPGPRSLRSLHYGHGPDSVRSRCAHRARQPAGELSHAAAKLVVILCAIGRAVDLRGYAPVTFAAAVAPLAASLLLAGGRAPE